MTNVPVKNDGLFYLQMSTKERKSIEILVCEDNVNYRNNLKMALRSLGFVQISDASSLNQGLKKLEMRRFSHVIFQARKSDIVAGEFLERALTSHPETTLLALSFEPTVDNVFSLLIGGARGYLVCPYDLLSLDHAVIQATKGEPMPAELLTAKDRNEALVAITMSNLDRVATTCRQAKKFEAVKKHVPQEMAKLRISAEMAHLFCEGGLEGFCSSVEKFSEKRGNSPSTKLGRLRKRLNDNRGEE
jgi:response regulator RpfG family c-di-GMP phosphodiesterase